MIHYSFLDLIDFFLQKFSKQIFKALLKLVVINAFFQINTGLLTSLLWNAGGVSPVNFALEMCASFMYKNNILSKRFLRKTIK